MTHGESDASGEDDSTHHPDLVRRRLLIGAIGTGGVAGLGLIGCSSSGTKASSTTAPASTAAGAATTTTAGKAATVTTVDAQACTLTREMTAGPYHVEGAAVRRDITEDRPGFGLELAFTVIDSTTCAPLRDAAVDIWHCDASGEYSGWNGNTLAETFQNGRNDKTFLRGIQLTDAAGIARFATIYPGWYEGRAIHIHLKVHTDGHAGKVYEGGHITHVGQVFFDDDFSDSLMKLGVYGRHTGTRTRNSEDSIFAAGGAEQIVRITPKDPADPEAGFTGAVTLAVQPDATPEPMPLA